MKKDIFGIEPKIGDTIVFNPPKYKGLVTATCIGFTKSGNVMLNNFSRKFYWIEEYIKRNGYYSPKTGFVIIRFNICRTFNIIGKICN